MVPPYTDTGQRAGDVDRIPDPAALSCRSDLFGGVVPVETAPYSIPQVGFWKGAEPLVMAAPAVFPVAFPDGAQMGTGDVEFAEHLFASGGGWRIREPAAGRSGRPIGRVARQNLVPNHCRHCTTFALPGLAAPWPVCPTLSHRAVSHFPHDDHRGCALRWTRSWTADVFVIANRAWRRQAQGMALGVETGPG